MTQHQTTTPQDSLQDTVVLITGGANGAGASLAKLCCQSGGYVCIGDMDRANGEQLVKMCRENWPSLDEPGVSRPPRAIFHPTDVTDYQSVLGLFDKAFDTFKRIDHVAATVVATTNIFQLDDSFDHSLTLRSVREPPLCKVVDVNLAGSLNITRIASVYLRHNRGVDNDRSILLFTRGASQADQATQAVEAIMRSLRTNFASPYLHNLRINTISPVSRSNTIEEVALVSAGVLTDPSLHGKSLFVEGGRAGEIEAAVHQADVKRVPEQPKPKAMTNGVGGQTVAAAGAGVP